MRCAIATSSRWRSILKERKLFNDNWIYIHDPGVKVGRIQNFKSWSPEMVPDPDVTCYGLEYFCFEGDGLWNSTDAELIELAKRELEQLGLAKRGDVVDGCVVRQPKAYPVYDDDYARHVDDDPRRAGGQLSEPAPGRPQRHAQVQQPGPRHDDGDAVRGRTSWPASNGLRLWQVNQDAEYHEAGKAGVRDHLTADAPTAVHGRLVPLRAA